ncbi:enoyl-CoA hydratase/isomerase family protein [Viridibacillus sp. YIM B01967]|uniref:Enoyl-CoA hydratase/isomerase family protein n=1 Tax=Viridibacillus soli TaxID=2798301 RepID=A0ABS1H377_9BACL|nr:enoyl-CoA hydratase/isomerase family protein [Viridibacillus soli]MBK3493869.1 enoyl-CoA hydratase/isomerase family protein [Viridibacillus soli]
MNAILTEIVGDNGQILNVTLNRPKMLNAFNTKMAEYMLSLLKVVSTDPSIRVVLLTSSNSEAFCSGADLKELKGLSEETWKAQHELFEQMFYALEDLPQPTIAVVNGYALAGGFELALNCDFLVAAKTAKFGLPEVTRGIMPGCGGSRLLPKRVPLHKAKQWLFTGEIFGVEEANDAGLLNAVVPPEELFQTALKLANKIAKNAPLGVQGCKICANTLGALSNSDARKREIEIYNLAVNSEDRLEGVRAFNEKRAPNFAGK